MTKITLQMSPYSSFIDFLEIETDNLPIKSGPKQTNLEYLVYLQIDRFSLKYGQIVCLHNLKHFNQNQLYFVNFLLSRQKKNLNCLVSIKKEQK